MLLTRRIYLIMRALVLSLLLTMASACAVDTTPIRVPRAGPLEDGLITLAAA